MRKKTKHFFEDGHDNVLNLDFDDIGTDVIYNGHLFKTMTMEQAEMTVDFIEKMIGRGNDMMFYVHCRAGMSRSRAIGEWIFRYCKENGIEVAYEDRDDYTTMYNVGVMQRLNHAYWKKHGFNEYAEEGKEYPQELVNGEPKIINREGY